jgi:hypothetical protein
MEESIKSCCPGCLQVLNSHYYIQRESYHLMRGLSAKLGRGLRLFDRTFSPEVHRISHKSLVQQYLDLVD